jgi:hypothetical protein
VSGCRLAGNQVTDYNEDDTQTGRLARSIRSAGSGYWHRQVGRQDVARGLEYRSTPSRQINTVGHVARRFPQAEWHLSWHRDSTPLLRVELRRDHLRALACSGNDGEN